MDEAGVKTSGPGSIRSLVVGFGNTLRSDDGLGPRIVEDLAKTTLGQEGNIRLVTLPQLDVALAVDLAETDLVVFVDARDDDKEQLVEVKRYEPEPGPLNHPHTSHTISIPSLLRVSLDWFGSSPECYVVAPKGYDFSLGECFSEMALLTATEAKERVLELLSS